jgi:hypothetical protein
MLSRELTVAMVASLVFVFAGCGGGSGGGTPSGGAGTGGGTGMGTLTWKEGGAMHTAIYPTAARVKSASSDGLQLAGGEGSGTAIALGILARIPPTLVPGTYSCADNAGGKTIVSASYTMGATSSGAPSACTVTVTGVGDATGTRAVGTFSATLPFGSALEDITDGKFDLPLTVSSI